MKIVGFGICFALFLFTLPIPGTIALRNILTLILLAFIFPLWRQFNLASLFSGGDAIKLISWTLVMTAWLIAQAAFISTESTWAFREIGSQWLPVILSIPIGVTAVLLSRHLGFERQRIFTALMIIFLAQTAFSLIVTVPDFLANESFPQYKTALTAGKLEISYWNNLLLVFLAVDGLSRWLYRQSISTLPIGVLVVGIILIFISNLAFGARNGVIGSLLLVSSLTLLVLWHERQKMGAGKTVGVVCAAIALIALLGWVNYQLDPRWARFEETARVAWQGESNAWLNPDTAIFPDLKSGGTVEVSAYARIAWIRAGLDLIQAYPLGVGYGRNAFGHALRKTMETRLGHSHSGLVDWTIGVGLPGLLLWLSFLATLAAVGIRRYFARQDPAGLILTFVVGGFFGRMLLDSINRDHMLIVFFLTLAILVTATEEPAQL